MSNFRYLSGREKLNSVENLSKDRHLYLRINQAEPNLGYVGEKSLPAGISTFYSLVTVNNGTTYDRYWKEQGIRIQDEGSPVGIGNEVNTLNFVGIAVTVLLTSSSSVDIRVVPPGSDTQIIYNANNEFAAASDFHYSYVTNRVGIGTNLPEQKLDLRGSLRITNDIYDSKNIVGLAGSVLVSTNGNGVVWGKGAPVSIGTIPHMNAIEGELWWNKITGNLKLYYDDGNSKQWVDASNGMGIQGLQGTQGVQGLQSTQGTQGVQGSNDGGVNIINDQDTNEIRYITFNDTSSGVSSIIGVSSEKLVYNPFSGNVGLGTQNPTSKLSVFGDGYFSGIITSVNGFISAANTSPVNINVNGNKLIFTVVGIGSTTLLLY